MATFNHNSPIGGLKHLKQRIDELNLLKVEIGWFASAQHPVLDSDGNQTGTIPMATIAYRNEFGKGVPARPFMRPALSSNRALWRNQIRQGSRAIIQGSDTDESLMEKIGLSVSGHIRAEIAQIQSPKLSEKTVEARLAIRADKTTRGLIDKPLVFEGIFYNSLTYIVKDGEEVRPFDDGSGR